MLGICWIEGCQAPAYCKQMCKTHYRRVAERGSPDLPPKPIPETCSVEGCHRIGSTKRLCGLHYSRKKRLGTTAILTPEQRFWNHVDRSGGPDACWPWKLSVKPGGYGAYGTRAESGGTKATEIAHRYAYQLANGPIPDGLHVLHRCDNPRCCNPTHLWLGTNADNVADKMAKGRYRPLKGVLNPRAELTEDQVREIRRLHSETGLQQKLIAGQFGISPSRVWQIVHRKQWRHI